MSQRSGQNWRGGNRRGSNRPTHNPGSVHSRLGVPRAGNRSNPGARRNGPNAGGRRWQNVADRGNEREEGFLQDARERLEEARRRGLEYEQPGFQEAMIQDRIFVVENQVYGQDDGMPSLQVETAAPGDVDYRRDNGSLQVTVEPGHHDVDYRRVQVKTSDSERGSYGMEPSPPHHDRSHDNPRHEPYRMYPSDYPEMATRERSAERDFRDPYDRRDVRHETPERADLEPFDIGADRAGDFRDRSRSRTRDDRREFPQDRDRRSKEFEDDRGRDRNRRSREDDRDRNRLSREDDRSRNRLSREDDRERDRNRLSRENDQGRDRNRLSREDDQGMDRNRLSREDDRERDRNRHSRNVDVGSDTNRRSGDVEPVSEWEAQLRERAREFGRQQKEESRQRGSRERTDPWLDSHEERDSRRASWERQQRSRSYDRLQEDVYDREQGEAYDQRYRREELVGQSGAAYSHDESYRDERAYSAPRSPVYDNAAFPSELPPDGRDARDQYLGSDRREDQSALQQTAYHDDVYRNFPGDQSPRYALDEFGRPVAPLHHEEYLQSPPAGSGIHGDRIHGDRHARSSSRTPSPVVLHGHEEEMYEWDRGKGRSSDSLYSAVSSKPIPDMDNRGEYRPTDRGPRVGDPYDADYGRMDAREREYQYAMQEEMSGESLEYQPPGDPGRGEEPSWNSRQEDRGEQRSWNSRQEKREGRDTRDTGRRERYAKEKQEMMDRDRDLRNRSGREGERSRNRDQGRRDSQGKREQHTSSRPRDRDYEQQRDLQRSLADEINKIRQDPDQADRQRKTEHQRSSRSSRGNSRDQQSYRKRSEKSNTSRTSEQRSSPKPAGKDSRSAKRKRSQSLSPRRKSRGRQEDGRGSRTSRDKEGDGRRRRSPRDSRREGSRRGQSPSRDESRGRKEDTREKRTRGPSLSDQTNPRQQPFAEEESGQLWPLQPPSTMAPQGQEATNWALETPQVHDQHAGLPPWQPVSVQGSYHDFGREGSSLYHSSAQESTAGMGPQSGEGSDMPPGERGRTIVEIQPAVETGNAHTSELWDLQNAGSKASESLSQPSTASQKGATQANLVEIPSFQQAQEMKKQKSKSSLELPSAPQRFPPSMSFPEKLLILAESYGVRTRQEVEVRIHKYEKEVKDGYLNSRTEDNMDDKAVEHLAEHLPRGGLWKLKLLRRIIVECLPKKTAEMKNKILWLCKQLLPPEGIEVTEAVFTALLAKRVTKYGLKKSSTVIPTPANLQQLEPKQVKNEEKRDMVVEYLQRLGVPATREAINGMLQNNQMLENIEKTFWVPHQDRRLVERYLQQIQVPVTPEAVNKIMGNPDILADIKKTLGVQGSKEGNDDPQSSAMATSSMATASHKPPASLSMTQKGAAISSTKSDTADASPYQHLLSTAPRHQNQPAAPLAMASSTAASVMYKQPSPHMSQASSRGPAGTDSSQQRVQNSPYGGPAQMHGQQQRSGYSEGGQQPRQLDSSRGGNSGGQQQRQLDSSCAGYSEVVQQQRQQNSLHGGYSQGGQQQRQLMHGEGGQQPRQLNSSRGGYSEGGQQQRQLDSLHGLYSEGGQQPRQLMHGEGGQQQRQPDSSRVGYSKGGQQQIQPDSSRVGYSEQQHRAEGQPSGLYGGYDSATQRAAMEYRGRVDPAQQQLYAPTTSPLQPGISERLQHFTTQAAGTGPAAMAGESLESTRVFIMDLFRQVNLAWVPESTVQEILRNQELVEQIQRFRAVGMPLELLVNYLKQCLQLVSRP